MKIRFREERLNSIKKKKRKEKRRKKKKGKRRKKRNEQVFKASDSIPLAVKFG